MSDRRVLLEQQKSLTVNSEYEILGTEDTKVIKVRKSDGFIEDQEVIDCKRWPLSKLINALRLIEWRDATVQIGIYSFTEEGFLVITGWRKPRVDEEIWIKNLRAALEYSNKEKSKEKAANESKRTTKPASQSTFSTPKAYTKCKRQGNFSLHTRKEAFGLFPFK